MIKVQNKHAYADIFQGLTIMSCVRYCSTFPKDDLENTPFET